MKLQTFDAFKHIQAAEGSHLLTEEELRQLQLCLLEMLRDVNRFCREKQISFCITGGSALGAARHHGMIPWDDDIDLLMPREDFDRFMNLFPEQYGNKYAVQKPGVTKGYPVLFGRIRLRGTSVRTRDDFYTDDQGAFLDIFIAENCPNSGLFRFVHGIGSLALGFLVSCRKFYRDRGQLRLLVKENEELARITKIKSGIGFLISFFSVECWGRMADHWHRLCRNKMSQYVVIPSGRRKYFHERFLRKDVCEYEMRVFDGQEVPCMKGLDRYLTLLYGRDWKIPPKENHEAHIYLEPFYLGVYSEVKNT